MASLTAREVHLIAHYRFARRLDEVLTKALQYQNARRGLDPIQVRVSDAQRTMDAVEQHTDVLPQDLGLHALASDELTAANRELEKVQAKLSEATDAFFDAAGEGAAAVVQILEEHHFQASREALESALEIEAAVDARVTDR